MSDDHNFLASDGGCPMIFKKPGRIVANACQRCRQSRLACDANRDLNRADCCERCTHGGNQ